MWQYNNTDELYHYGVLGMRWGHRNAEVKSAYNEYKQSKKDLRKARVGNLKNIFKKSTWVAGADNTKDYSKNRRKLKEAYNNREKAAFKLIDAAAKDAYNKKLAKTGSKEKATKASVKVHLKAWNQDKYGSGRVGSAADYKKGRGNERMYKHLQKTKGKEYASAVEKKYNSKNMRDIVGTAAVALGSAALAAYLNKKYAS